MSAKSPKSPFDGILHSLAGGYYVARLMPFPFDPSPSTLWTLHRNGKVVSCEVRFVPLGDEVRMLRNGSLLVSQVFFDGDEALAWAKEERETDG